RSLPLAALFGLIIQIIFHGPAPRRGRRPRRRRPPLIPRRPVSPTTEFAWVAAYPAAVARGDNATTRASFPCRRCGPRDRSDWPLGGPGIRRSRPAHRRAGNRRDGGPLTTLR